MTSTTTICDSCGNPMHSPRCLICDVSEAERLRRRRRAALRRKRLRRQVRAMHRAAQRNTAMHSVSCPMTTESEGAI